MLDHQSESHAQLFDNLGLVSVEDLARALDRSPKTIRNWVARREVPFLLVHGRIVFRRSSVEAWLKQKEFQPWQ